MKGRKIPVATRKEIAANIAAGVPVANICTLYGVSDTTVRRCCMENCVHYPPKGKAERDVSKNGDLWAAVEMLSEACALVKEELRKCRV